MRIGVISDTHGLVRHEALEALRGSELILHGGDIGSADVLTRLAAIAQVTAIRGNNDTDSWAQAIPATVRIDVEGVGIYMLHDIKDLAVDPRAHGIKVVVSGHSHRASIDTRDGVLFLNPGSAGPRRFKLPLTIANLTVSRGAARATLCELHVPASKNRSSKQSQQR